jgi:hypothetical protein
MFLMVFLTLYVRDVGVAASSPVTPTTGMIGVNTGDSPGRVQLFVLALKGLSSALISSSTSYRAAGFGAEHQNAAVSI